jgi:hypothetical protein
MMFKKIVGMTVIMLMVGMVLATSFASPIGMTITHLPLVQRAWVVPEGNLALLSDGFFNFDLILARPDGTLFPFKADQSTCCRPEFSPNGEYITVGAADNDPTSDTYVLAVDDPTTVLPLGDGESNTGIQWLPDSSALSYVVRDSTGGSDGLYVISLATLESNLVTSDQVASLGWFPNASQVAYSTSTDSTNGSRDIFRIERDGTAKTPLYTAPTEEYVWGVLSDGRIIFATTEGEGESMTGDFFSMNADGSNVIRLTNTPTLERGLSVSPDNRQLLLFDDNNVILMDTVGNPTISFDLSCFKAICSLYQVAWKADSSEVFYVIFAQNENGGQDFMLYRVRTDGSETIPRLVRRDAQQLYISDDGLYLGYEADIADERVTVITDLTTNTERIIRGEQGMRFFGWRPGVQEP